MCERKVIVYNYELYKQNTNWTPELFFKDIIWSFDQVFFPDDLLIYYILNSYLYYKYNKEDSSVI